MHVEKVAYAIRKLRRVNATLRPEQFDIEDWARRSECGTTACAIGWLLHEDPEAQQYLGMEVVFHEAYGLTVGALIPTRGSLCGTSGSGKTRLVSIAFDITDDQARDIFHRDGYDDLDREPTLTDVLDRFTMLFYLNGGTEEMLYDSDLHAMQIVERSLSEFTVSVEDEVF